MVAIIISKGAVQYTKKSTTQVGRLDMYMYLGCAQYTSEKIMCIGLHGVAGLSIACGGSGT